MKEVEVGGAGEVVAAGMLSGAEDEVVAAWGLPKLNRHLELAIFGQAKELKL